MNLRMIAGLGNPGEKYSLTRHNLGFRVIDELLVRLNALRPILQDRALVYRSSDLLLVKPMTYMNASGEAIGSLMRRYEIAPDELLVIYDDVNLNRGVIRIRPRGSHGGHNGMRSIIEQIKSIDFPRLRIGIGKPDGELIDYVLSPISCEEVDLYSRCIKIAADAVIFLCSNSIELTMSRFNGFVDKIVGDTGIKPKSSTP